VTAAASRPYIAITGDTHAGASIDMYREYLSAPWQQEFDAWRGAYKNPSKKLLGKKKTKNWDSAERRADLASDGVVAEVIFPNTVPLPARHRHLEHNRSCLHHSHIRSVHSRL
jgi:hypothetical protein